MCHNKCVLQDSLSFFILGYFSLYRSEFCMWRGFRILHFHWTLASTSRWRQHSVTDAQLDACKTGPSHQCLCFLCLVLIQIDRTWTEYSYFKCTHKKLERANLYHWSRISRISQGFCLWSTLSQMETISVQSGHICECFIRKWISARKMRSVLLQMYLW